LAGSPGARGEPLDDWVLRFVRVPIDRAAPHPNETQDRTPSGASEFARAFAIAAVVAVPWIVWRLRHLGVPIDFAVYRTGGLHVLQGVDLYIRQSAHVPISGFGQTFVVQHTFSYPPFSALTFVPLVFVPAWVGVLVWELGSLAALVALVRTSFREALDEVRYPWVVCGVIASVAVLTTPVTDTLYFGQVNLFIVLLVVADQMKAGRWRGVGTGVAAAMKLTPLPFILLFVITKQWRAAIRAGAAFAVATALAWVVLPAASWSYWTDPSAALRRVGGIDTFANQSLHGMFAVLGLPMWPLPVAVVGLSVAGLLLARREHLAGRTLAAVCCVGLLTLLISPVSWVHHAVWIVPVAGVVVAEGRSVARIALAAAIAVLFILRIPLFGSVLLSNGGSSFLGHLLEIVDVLVYLALLATLALTARPRRA
jgi:alpha-1,2-mannosyltransferase